VDRAPDDHGADYARLAQIKSEWDPGNLFHMDQNIAPKN
jgi:FAD/FMN-containing dehydrogenase